jgi:hypothetical protein
MSRIIESLDMVDGPFEDWSAVRSPARARRRRHKHPQRIRIFYKPKLNVIHFPNGDMVCHPVVAQKWRLQLAKQESQRRASIEYDVWMRGVLR